MPGLEIRLDSIMVAESKKHLIVVLGMHRSGTSATARALMVLGVELGNNLGPALPSINEKGFWEDLDVYQLNEDLLGHMGVSWDSLDPLFEERLSAESVAPFRQRARDLLRQKTADSDWFGMKDPRVARLLPFWKAVFADLDLDVSYVVAIRNPLSVAASLAKRDDFAKEKSQYLWLQHTLSALRETKRLRRTVLDFDWLMAEPKVTLCRVASDLGLADRLDEAQLDDFCTSFLEDSLRHSRFCSRDLYDDPAVPKLTTDVFELLTRVTAGDLSIDSAEATASLLGFSDELERLRPALRFMAEVDAAASAAASKVNVLSQELIARDGQLEVLNELLAARDEEIVILRRALTDRDGRIATLSLAATERDAMAASTSWRVTRPLRTAVALLRGDPAYRARFRKVFGRVENTTDRSSDGAASLQLVSSDPVSDQSTRNLSASALPDPVPLVTYPDPSPVRAGRLTVMTDSFGTQNLFGGDAVPILFAVALARHRGLRLRVVTRDIPPEPAHFGAVLAAHRVAYAENIEFEYAPAQMDARGLAVSDQDLVLTTSYWTTAAALKNFAPSRIIYLVQEEESLFYPAGDQQIRCREVFCDTRLRFLVSTSALLNYLIADGMTGIAARGIAFEPAFPSSIYYKEPRPPASKRRFCFYARPDIPRDLFLRGLEAVASAMESGILAAPEWDVHFVGKDMPSIDLPRGIRPRIHTKLPLDYYGELIRQVDVGLSLSYAPQPSYPPLALAASGAVVVTNRYGPKQSLAQYCANILCVDPSLNELAAALDEAGKLAVDEPRRQANFASARMNRDWETAFAPALEIYGEKGACF